MSTKLRRTLRPGGHANYRCHRAKNVSYEELLERGEAHLVDDEQRERELRRYRTAFRLKEWGKCGQGARRLSHGLSDCIEDDDEPMTLPTAPAIRREVY